MVTKLNISARPYYLAYPTYSGFSLMFILLVIPINCDLTPRCCLVPVTNVGSTIQGSVVDTYTQNAENLALTGDELKKTMAQVAIYAYTATHFSFISIQLQSVLLCLFLYDWMRYICRIASWPARSAWVINRRRRSASFDEVLSNHFVYQVYFCKESQVSSRWYCCFKPKFSSCNRN